MIRIDIYFELNFLIVVFDHKTTTIIMALLTEIALKGRAKTSLDRAVGAWKKAKMNKEKADKALNEAALKLEKVVEKNQDKILGDNKSVKYDELRFGYASSKKLKTNTKYDQAKFYEAYPELCKITEKVTDIHKRMENDEEKRKLKRLGVVAVVVTERASFKVTA